MFGATYALSRSVGQRGTPPGAANRRGGHAGIILRAVQHGPFCRCCPPGQRGRGVIVSFRRVAFLRTTPQRCGNPGSALRCNAGGRSRKDRNVHWKTFKTTQAAGYLFIVLSIVNWSGNFVASRGLAGMGEPGTLNLLRWGLATLLFAPFGFSAFWRERAEIFRQFIPMSAIALCGISLYDTLIFLAGHTSEALNMSLISTLSPLLTALAAQFFLRQRFHSSMYVGIGVSTLGVCLLVTDGNLGQLLSMRLAPGDLIILLTAMMSAVYNLIIKSVTGRISQRALLMACCLFGTVYLVPVALWEGGGRLVMPVMTPTLAWSLAYLSVFASLLCYLFWNMAVEVLGATKTTMFYYTLPPASAVVAWLVLGEGVNRNQMLSGLIIVAGIIIALYAGRPILARRRVRAHERCIESAN